MVETVKEFAGHDRFSLDIRPLQMSSRYQGTGAYGYNLVRHLMKIDTGPRVDMARKTFAVYRDVCARKGRNPNRGG